MMRCRQPRRPEARTPPCPSPSTSTNCWRPSNASVRQGRASRPPIWLTWSQAVFGSIGWGSGGPGAGGAPGGGIVVEPASPLVLVVEDDPAIQELLRDLLQAEGCVVEVLADG